MKTLCILLAMALQAGAAEVTLEWDASPSTNVSSYAIRYGLISRVYSKSLMFPASARTATITNLHFGTWYFAATARSFQGLESDPSNEVSATNRFVGLNLRVTRVNGDPTIIQGSDDLVVWQTLVTIPQDSAPVALAGKPRQFFRATGGTSSTSPTFSAASAPMPSAPTTHTEARTRAQRRTR